ncbi:hypothetical protein NKG05_07770 [Oerskovia sp. M15]
MRAEHAEWEGAAERVLRGFALSLLVPAQHYDAVSSWINSQDLGTRLVYHRVPAPAAGRTAKRAAASGPAREPRGRTAARGPARGQGRRARRLADRRARAPRGPRVRADPRRLPARVPGRDARGQVKHSASHHEKDDRRSVRDRSGYVLGWSNQAKIDALLEQATDVAARRTALEDKRDEVGREKGEVISRSGRSTASTSSASGASSTGRSPSGPSPSCTRRSDASRVRRPS